MGNPETSDSDDWRGMVDYAWSHAVISDETHKIIRESCDFNSNDTWSNYNCSEAIDELLTQYKEIDIYSLYTSLCMPNSASSSSMQTFTVKRSTTMVCLILYSYLATYIFILFLVAEKSELLYNWDGLKIFQGFLYNEFMSKINFGP